MNQNQKNSLLWIGTIVNTHGVKGEVRILTDSTNPEDKLGKGSTIYYYKGESLNELTINSFRLHKQFVLVTFEGINSINDIEWIKGNKVYVSRDELRDDEYYLSDLINLEVVDQNNTVIGIVTDVVDQGPYDSLILKLSNGNSTNIPIVDEYKVEYNKQLNKVFVNIPIELIQ